MSRNLTTAFADSLSQGHIIVCVLIELNFSSGVQRLNNSSNPINWNGYTWLGAGHIGSIDPVSENSENTMNGISMTLSGIPSEQIANALGMGYQGRSCRLWLASLNSDYTIISDPAGPFEYIMDTMNIELGNVAKITLQAESKFSDWDKIRTARYNDEDQKRYYPNDKGLEYVYLMENLVIE